MPVPKYLMDFTAGENAPQRHVLLLEQDRHFFLPFVLEHWCEMNCCSGWSIHQDDHHFQVSFDQAHDLVMFELSQYSDCIKSRLS